MKAILILALCATQCGCEAANAFLDGFINGQKEHPAAAAPIQSSSQAPAAYRAPVPYCQQYYVSGANGAPGQWTTVCHN